APHRLFGVMPAAVACSAALYRETALPVLDEIETEGRLPVLAGGTGLYLRS
ncbi:tRNA (adenosine(37)-N6)-dimethylallyltransferase MiaA, partial [Vibrio parahaemolyticus]